MRSQMVPAPPFIRLIAAEALQKVWTERCRQLIPVLGDVGEELSIVVESENVDAELFFRPPCIRQIAKRRDFVQGDKARKGGLSDRGHPGSDRRSVLFELDDGR